jgi:hypothetical protein
MVGAMICAKKLRAILAVCAASIFVALLSSAKAEKPYEDFNPKNFSHPTVIDNAWYPIKPGTRYIWGGTAVDEEGDEEAHSVAFVVTDLVKEIAGVRTVVCWNRDFVDKELEEAGIMFLAQDNNGAVWLLGEYPEKYSDKKFEKQSSWIHGSKDSHAGMLIKKEPKLNDEYSEGWAPSVEYTDHALVYQVGQKVKTPAGNFDDVIVIDESNRKTVGTHHLRSYARGTGVVHVGWRGKKTDQIEMILVKVEKIRAEEMAKARDAALKLDKHGYEVSMDVYALTKSIKVNSPAASK